MNRILVTGGFGYIGSVLVTALLQRGFMVTLMDSIKTDRPEWHQAIQTGKLLIVTEKY